MSTPETPSVKLHDHWVEGFSQSRVHRDNDPPVAVVEKSGYHHHKLSSHPLSFGPDRTTCSDNLGSLAIHWPTIASVLNGRLKSLCNAGASVTVPLWRSMMEHDRLDHLLNTLCTVLPDVFMLQPCLTLALFAR